MHRLFVAVLPPSEVLDRLAALARPSIDGVRWTDRAQWHVTLRFLGAVADAAPVHAALSALDAPAGPVAAIIGPAVSRFGRRILHVPVAGLDAIAADVVAATADLGWPPDDRPFKGHVTLARTAKHAAVDLRPLTGTPIAARWHVRSVSLMESRLSSRGARYHVLEEFPVTQRPRPAGDEGGPTPPPDGGLCRTS